MNDHNNEIPEMALWGAVFEQAVADVKNHRAAQNRRMAISWFQSDSVGVGSCVWLCALFNLYPDRVRTALNIQHNHQKGE